MTYDIKEALRILKVLIQNDSSLFTNKCGIVDRDLQAIDYVLDQTKQVRVRNERDAWNVLTKKVACGI